MRINHKEVILFPYLKKFKKLQNLNLDKVIPIGIIFLYG